LSLYNISEYKNRPLVNSYPLEKKGKKSDSIAMENGRAVIFTGGLGPKADRVKAVIEEAEITVAADSGWDLAVSMDVVPDYYIGDMDSITDHEGLKALTDERRMIHPVDKDYSDTELSIKFLEERNYRDIVLIGGGGGRIDHLLALTSLFSRTEKPAEWYTAAEHIIYTDENFTFPCKTGQTLSFFSATGDKASVTTRGAKWELNDFKLDAVNYSLSNTAVGTRVEVKVHFGAVLIMINYLSL